MRICTYSTTPPPSCYINVVRVCTNTARCSAGVQIYSYVHLIYIYICMYVYLYTKALPRIIYVCMYLYLIYFLSCYIDVSRVRASTARCSTTIPSHVYIYYIYIHIYIYMYVHVYIHVYMYIHTQKNPPQDQSYIYIFIFFSPLPREYSKM